MPEEYFYVQLQESFQVALPLEGVAEVISLARGEICPIPGVAPALLGVVNQRGRLLWVLDLSALLSLSLTPKRYRPQERLMLVVITTDSANPKTLACVVSAFKGIVPLNQKEVKRVPATHPSSIDSFVSGTTEIDQSTVAILNIKAVLAALQSTVPNI